MSGKPIIPIAVATSRFRSLDTWSRMTINLPWSKLAVVVGEPIRVAADADDAALEVARRTVEQAMKEATDYANQVLALGITSYNGSLYYGINADREAMSDVDVFPSLLREALDELREVAR